jgi:endonuclease I
MKKTYGLKLSEQEYALFIQWNQQYPVSPWEREHDEKIRQIQRSSKI